MSFSSSGSRACCPVPEVVRACSTEHHVAAGGVFKLELFLPEDYPMAPPKASLLTKQLSRQQPCLPWLLIRLTFTCWWQTNPASSVPIEAG